jgi:hypothetical protein
LSDDIPSADFWRSFLEQSRDVTGGARQRIPMNSSVYAPKPTSLRRYIKQFPILVSVKRFFWKFFDGTNGKTALNVLHTFRLFVPNSAGTYEDRAHLTIQTINQTMPFLSVFAQAATRRKLSIVRIETFSSSPDDLTAAHELKTKLDQYGSDKARLHDYHYLYGPILKDRDKIRGVLEIGMGTNNTDSVSNMGMEGRPGASLRAFRDFLKNADIYGADIDKRILFNEDRIKTFYVNQVDVESFDLLERSVPSDLDLIIDDGLHAPDANIATLAFAINKIKAGGWVVIEDIAPDAIPVWGVVAALLPGNFRCHLFDAEGGVDFAVNRIT